MMTTTCSVSTKMVRCFTAFEFVFKNFSYDDLHSTAAVSGVDDDDDLFGGGSDDGL